MSPNATLQVSSPQRAKSFKLDHQSSPPVQSSPKIVDYPINYLASEHSHLHHCHKNTSSIEPS